MDAAAAHPSPAAAASAGGTALDGGRLRWLRRPAAITALVAALAGCGAGVPSPRPGASSPPPGGSAASPKNALVAVLDRPLGSSGNVLHLVSLAGVEVARSSLSDTVEAVTVAGRRALIAGDGRILSLDAAGRLAEAERIAPADPDVLLEGLVADPAGRRWLWSEVRNRGDGTLESRVSLGGEGAPPRLLVDRVAAARVLVPLRWTGAGPVLSDEPTGIGGYVLFRRGFGDTLRLDVADGRLTPLLPAGCALSDLAADGTAACVLNGREAGPGPGPVTLRLLPAHGAARDLALPAWVGQAGAAFFSPDGRSLSLAFSAATGDPGEHVATELLDVATLARRPLPADGLIPVGWSATGVLVTARLAGLAGGAPGVYAVAGGSTVTPVCPQPNALGVSG